MATTSPAPPSARRDDAAPPAGPARPRRRLRRRLRRWSLPTALLVLAVVPVVAGASRLAELLGMAATLPAPAHSSDAPVVLAVHVVSSTAFAIGGAFQLVGGTRGRRTRWHAASGRVAVASGLVAAATGLALTVVITDADSALLTAFRASAGAAMGAALVLGLVAIRRGDVRRHRAWVLRGYAIGMGAGTQVLTAGLVPALVGPPSPTTHALLMGAGWLVNVVVAERVLRRRPTGQRLA